MAFDEFESESLRHLDDQLARAFAGTKAPGRLRTSVMTRVTLAHDMPPPTRMPEFLDGIALMAVLSFAAGFAFFLILK